MPIITFRIWRPFELVYEVRVCPRNKFTNTLDFFQLMVYNITSSVLGDFLSIKSPKMAISIQLENMRGSRRDNNGYFMESNIIKGNFAFKRY